MINVMLIDDEEPALLEMEFLLKDYPFIHILGKFTNPVEALEKFDSLKPHAVFIDINMPQLGGMTMTKKLRESMDEVNVIFVTAYEQYAVEAFNVEAMDYLLKPVSKERLDQTIVRLMRDGLNPQNSEDILEIRTMGGLQICFAGRDSVKWRTEKEKELFAFLLNSRGIELSRDRIVDELWGESEIDRAARQVHNAIYYIKKTLKEYGISQEQIRISGHYCLQLGNVWYDRLLIENTMKEHGTLNTITELEALLAIFGEGYLQKEGWAWAEQDRESLQRYELSLLSKLSKKYMEAGMLREAEQTLKDSYYKNPFEENITYLLMELYRKTGESVKAVKHYTEYQKILREELKIRPQENIKQLYESIRNESSH